MSTDQITAVDAALSWVDLNMNVDRDPLGLWKSNFPQPSRGDRIMGKREWEQRPHAAARILAAEVRRLRALVPHPCASVKSVVKNSDV